MIAVQVRSGRALGPFPIPRAVVALGSAVAALVIACAMPVVVLAHGTVDEPPLTALTLLFGWSFDPLVQIPVLVAAVAFVMAVRHVNAAHPGNRVPRARVAAWLAGLLAIEIALQSGIERYDTILFSIHMVQHILLAMIAAPLLAAGAPITLLLRLATADVRRRRILPVLHSRIVRVLSFPVVAWILFAAVMWGTHFSPLFDAALENPLIHDLEHLLFLAAGLLFWWPVVGLDPSPWRMPHPVRGLYAFLQMPQNTFLSLAIFSASEPLYPHYATLVRTWQPDALSDQQAAGAIMWVAGDLTFLVAILLIVRAWMQSEDRSAAANDARVAVAEAALREREAGLAARRETPPQPGSGVAR